MTTTYLAELVSQLRTDLGDPSGGTQRWSDADLQRAIGRSLAAFSRHHPCEQKSTMATVLGDYAINIASLAGLISVDRLEFPVDNKPPYFKPFSIIQSTLFMQEWGTAANCYIYWSGMHTLTDLTRTYDIKYGDLIELGALAFALEQYSDAVLAGKISIALESANIAIAKVTSKITLAESALTNAAGVATDIATQLTGAGTQLTASLAALSAAISTAAGSIDASIAAKLTDVAARVTTAAASLTSATSSITASSTRLSAAASDLASGDDYIPTANTGLDPAGKWAIYAGRDIEAANSCIQQADAYIRQAAENIAGANIELAVIAAHDDKRKAYITTGQQYIAAADTYTRIASELNLKRQAYLQTAGHHIATARTHVEEGRQYQQNAAGYREEARAMSWQAKSKMAAFQKELIAGSITRQIKTIQMSAEI